MEKCRIQTIAIVVVVVFLSTVLTTVPPSPLITLPQKRIDLVITFSKWLK